MRTRFAPSLLALALCAACGTAKGPSGARRNPEIAEVIAAALGHFAARNEGAVRVDPRPLRMDASLTGVHDSDFATDGTAVALSRSRFLRERGIDETDAVAEMRCVFSRGVQLPDSVLRLEPDSIRERRARCLQAAVHTTFAFTRAEGLQGEQAARFGGGAVHLRAYRLTSWSFEVWDLYLQPRSAGWMVADSRRLAGVAS